MESRIFLEEREEVLSMKKKFENWKNNIWQRTKWKFATRLTENIIRRFWKCEWKLRRVFIMISWWTSYACNNFLAQPKYGRYFILQNCACEREIFICTKIFFCSTFSMPHLNWIMKTNIRWSCHFSKKENSMKLWTHLHKGRIQTFSLVRFSKYEIFPNRPFENQLILAKIPNARPQQSDVTRVFYKNPTKAKALPEAAFQPWYVEWRDMLLAASIFIPVWQKKLLSQRSMVQARLLSVTQ